MVEVRTFEASLYSFLWLFTQELLQKESTKHIWFTPKQVSVVKSRVKEEGAQVANYQVG